MKAEEAQRGKASSPVSHSTVAIKLYLVSRELSEDLLNRLVKVKVKIGMLTLHCSPESSFIN